MKKALIIQARMLGLSWLITCGLVLIFIMFALVMGQMTGEYHCNLQGGELIGTSCVIEGGD